MDTRPTKHATACVYEDLEELIRVTAARFADRYCRPFEDCLAEANKIFLEAFYSYDPDRHENLEKRVQFLVWKGLLTEVRLTAQRYGRLWRKWPSLTRVPVRPDPDPFEPEWLLSCLDPDAKEVVRHLLHESDDLDATLGDREAHATGNRNSAKRILREFLRTKLGWTTARISRAFEQITEALS